MPISDPPEGRWGWAPDGVDAATSHVPTLRLCCHPMPKQGVGCGWLVCSSRHQHAMMQGRAPASPWLHACATAWDRGLHIGSTYGRNMHQQPQAAAGQCMLQLERPTVCTRMLHPGQQHRGSPPPLLHTTQQAILEDTSAVHPGEHLPAVLSRQPPTPA